MNDTSSIYDTERIFLRSCLESAPGGAGLRNFTAYHAREKQAPTRLHLLKQKLLHTALEQTPHPQIRKQLCGAANAAAELAWNTNCPLLFFPCLFEEMAKAIHYRFDLEQPEEDHAGYSSIPERNNHGHGGVNPEYAAINPISSAKTLPMLLTLAEK